MYKLLTAAIRPCLAALLVPFALLGTASMVTAQNTPVVVELFTSEGCSSCPPADELLAQLNAKQPVPGADIIVLSEHVDYWNSLGWKDPFSSSVFSERQRQYAVTLHSEDVYTPQAVVDGRTGVVGNNGKQLVSAIQEAARGEKIPLALKAERHGDTVTVNVGDSGGGSVWVALVEAKMISHVLRGENGGRTLQHVGVVRAMQKLNGESATLTVDPAWGTNGLRVVAFAQAKHSMKIIAAAQADISSRS